MAVHAIHALDHGMNNQTASISRKYFSREISRTKKNSREILEKFEKKNSKFKFGFFYTFGILTTKMYTKLDSIEINDEILSKVVGIRKNLGTKLANKL
jgi:hypothetical protein